MFSAHPTTDPGILFAPKPSKKHTSELTLKMNHLKPITNKQPDQNRLPTRFPNPPKIIENPTLDPFAVPVDPWITNMVTQGVKITPRWYQKGILKVSRGDPCQQSTS